MPEGQICNLAEKISKHFLIDLGRCQCGAEVAKDISKVVQAACVSCTRSAGAGGAESSSKALPKACANKQASMRKSQVSRMC